MWLTDSDTRKRHAFIDNTLRNTSETISNESCVQHLGEVGVSNVVTIISRGYVPNVRHGEVQIPASRSDPGDDSIPIIALRPDETVRLPKGSMGPTGVQLQRAAEKAKRWYPGEPAERIMGRISSAISHGNLEISYVPALAYVVSQPYLFQTSEGNLHPTRRFVKGRPMLCMQMREADYDRLDPTTVVHEAVHIEQSLSLPVAEFSSAREVQDYALRMELEAYHRQRLSVDALVDMSYAPDQPESKTYVVENGRPLSRAGLVDDLRELDAAGRKDKFYPSRALQKQLGERGIDIVVELPEAQQEAS